ncbi:Hypothetical_protein [Hexamita inflata]|uniref:Hypothetical_protein n=1 Tax=Hexamita inflata TaxID=28002 RepID=A0ABP1HIX5_9EUKA
MFKVIVATIRTNLSPPISETVKFTRLVEQLCKQYQVKTIHVSSQIFQFFVQEETIQKMLDQVVQICAGAKTISESLRMTVSAGIAFGDIEQVTQIFGNLQYRCFYGDVIEISDIVSQQSFDQIMVELSSMYNINQRKQQLINNYLINQPKFIYSINTRQLIIQQKQYRITAIENITQNNYDVQVLMKKYCISSQSDNNEIETTDTQLFMSYYFLSCFHFLLFQYY